MDSFMSGNVPRTAMSAAVTLALIGLTILALVLLTVASVRYLTDVLSGEQAHAEQDEPTGQGPGRVAP